MRSRAHHLLLLVPLLAAGCSTQFELSTETRTPSETTETVEKLHSSVGIDVLSSAEESSESRPEEPPALPVKSVEVDGNGNIVVIIEGDVHEHPQKPVAKKPTSGWNSKIGWPTQLKGASSWTVACYLAVWGLVLAAIALMIDNLKRNEGGPLLSIIAMLGTAAVLLQFLPHAESGAQLIPLSPWAYAGWEAFFVSLVCWTVILGAVFVVFVQSQDSPQAFAILCLIAMFLNVLLSWSDLKEDLASRPQAAAYQHVEASTLPT